MVLTLRWLTLESANFWSCPTMGSNAWLLTIGLWCTLNKKIMVRHTSSVSKPLSISAGNWLRSSHTDVNGSSRRASSRSLEQNFSFYCIPLSTFHLMMKENMVLQKKVMRTIYWQMEYNRNAKNYTFTVYSSADTVCMTKSRRMWWVWHVTCKTEIQNPQNILIEKSEGQDCLAIHQSKNGGWFYQVMPKCHIIKVKTPQHQMKVIGPLPSQTASDTAKESPRFSTHRSLGEAQNHFIIAGNMNSHPAHNKSVYWLCYYSSPT